MPPIFWYRGIKITQGHNSAESFFYNLHGEKWPQGHELYGKGSHFPP
jgi:hypothetical protein